MGFCVFHEKRRGFTRTARLRFPIPVDEKEEIIIAENSDVFSNQLDERNKLYKDNYSNLEEEIENEEDEEKKRYSSENSVNSKEETKKITFTNFKHVMELRKELQSIENFKKLEKEKIFTPSYDKMLEEDSLKSLICEESVDDNEINKDIENSTDIYILRQSKINDITNDFI